MGIVVHQLWSSAFSRKHEARAVADAWMFECHWFFLSNWDGAMVPYANCVLCMSGGTAVSSPSSSPAHRLCSKPFDGGKEQKWSEALPVKTNRFMVYYRFIGEFHNRKWSLWHIETAKKNKKGIIKIKKTGQRAKSAARPPGNVPVLPMASPHLAIMDAMPETSAIMDARQVSSAYKIWFAVVLY